MVSKFMNYYIIMFRMSANQSFIMNSVLCQQLNNYFNYISCYYFYLIFKQIINLAATLVCNYNYNFHHYHYFLNNNFTQYYSQLLIYATNYFFSEQFIFEYSKMHLDIILIIIDFLLKNLMNDYLNHYFMCFKYFVYLYFILLFIINWLMISSFELEFILR